ncbi:MAG: AAA family ATPase [Nitrosomonadaceae bacterium]
MKIKNIDIKNHSILGDLCLDLRCPKDPKNVANNIVLAGENGTGKSALIGIINSLSGRRSIKKVNDVCSISVTFEIVNDLKNNEYALAGSIPSTEIHKVKEIKYIFTSPRGVDMQLTSSEISSAKDHFKIPVKESSKLMMLLSANLRGLCIPPEVSFKGGYNDNINHDIDDGIVFSDFTKNAALYTTKLLAALQIRDLEELNFSPEIEHKKRIDRFKKAFNLVFENLKFEKCLTKKNNTIAIFSDANGERSMDSLSSGEKQVVVKLAVLVKNINNDDCTNVLITIDEPETYLHPKWQKKLYSAVSSLFTNAQYHPQIFTATTSPYIVEQAMKEDNLVVGLKKDPETGKISIYSGDEYGDWEMLDTIKEIFSNPNELIEHKKELALRQMDEKNAKDKEKFEAKIEALQEVVLKGNEKARYKVEINIGDGNNFTHSFNNNIDNKVINEGFKKIFEKLNEIEGEENKQKAVSEVEAIKEQLINVEGADSVIINASLMTLMKISPYIGKTVVDFLSSL